jgi:hypothetical protein
MRNSAGTSKRKHSDGLSVSSTVTAMITPSSDIATLIEHFREREGGAAKRNPQTTTAMADKQIRACSVLRSSPRTVSSSRLMTSGNDTEYRRLGFWRQIAEESHDHEYSLVSYLMDQPSVDYFIQ